MAPRKVDLDELLRLREAGLNGPQIAAALGVSAMAVRRWCRRLGCPLPGPRNGHGRVSMPVAPGKRYGRLLVVADAGVRDLGRKVWECRCDCGRVVPVAAPLLLAGKTRSCGCLRREETAARCAELGRRVQSRRRAERG